MAIDSTEKKLSLLAFQGTPGGTMPTPDGALDQGDLQHLLERYSGILWTLTVIIGGIPGLRLAAVAAESRIASVVADHRTIDVTAQ